MEINYMAISEIFSIYPADNNFGTPGQVVKIITEEIQPKKGEKPSGDIIYITEFRAKDYRRISKEGIELDLKAVEILVFWKSSTLIDEYQDNVEEALRKHYKKEDADKTIAIQHCLLHGEFKIFL